MSENTSTAPWSRVAILVFSLVAIALVAHHTTGAFLPSDSSAAFIFQNALLLIVMGSALIEHKFTEPADSLVNSLMATITLVGAYTDAPATMWWIVTTYCVGTFVFSMTCVAVSSSPSIQGWRRSVADFSYRPAVVLGKARIIFSIVFLFGVLSFYGMRDSRSAELVLFWGIFIAIWPLKVAEFISSIGRGKPMRFAEGRIVRMDSPNLIRIALDAAAKWDNTLLVCQLADGKQSLILPLFKQAQDNQILGTGLLVEIDNMDEKSLVPGFVYAPTMDQKSAEEKVVKKLGGAANSRLIGFVVEDSDIGSLKIETWRSDLCREGILLWCWIGDQKVFYQVVEGKTKEESLESDRHGYQIAEATQLGILDGETGFKKFTWLPVMNTPVFCEGADFGTDLQTVAEGDFVYGTVPYSNLRVGGAFHKFWDHHTAIIGTTGSGKTELAFDLLRYAQSNGLKVICIDLTNQYMKRLSDLGIWDLSVPGEVASELGEKLFDVETGAYGGHAEKGVLRDFAEGLRSDVQSEIERFLTSKNEEGEVVEGNPVGLITLEEISNTKATLYITELYLTCLLHYAKDHLGECPEVLVVVEEAHTVMPEPNTMGLGDYDSKGLVSKIAQIALQGRKYGVGLLVIAQRTATVSKTVLTQCNTMISFRCFDETSLSFLKNIFSEEHVSLIPNLPKLQAVIFGKSVRSEQPVVVAIPYDAKKAELE